MRSPTNPAPIRPESPTPRMVSASPVATWLTASPSAISAKTSDINVPATMPNSAPMKMEPVSHAPAKPDAAPMIIMPSTPRLSTPARSVTSSPVAAIKSGVEAARIERTMASSSPIGGPSLRQDQPDPVENERIAGQHIEQQDALEYLGHIKWNLHRDLRLFATDEGQRQE